MIEAIRQHNRTALPEFLTAFDESALSTYLDRLTKLTNTRGRNSQWVRNTESPAIVTRAHAA